MPTRARAILALLTTLAAGPAAAQDEPPVRFAWDDHPTLLFGGDGRLAFTVTLQADGRRFPRGYDAPDGSFAVERQRVGVEGEIFDRVRVEAEYDFASGRPWRDAYAGVELWPWLRVKAGRLKMPFGREAQTPVAKLPFVYRTIASSRLAPGRDTGLVVHGRIARRKVTYSAGVFRGGGDHAAPADPPFVRDGEPRARETTAAAELVVAPFRKQGNGSGPLSFGVAMTSSRLPEGLHSLSGETEADVEFFPRMYVKGSRKRVGAHATWTYGPVSGGWEYLFVRDERKQQGFGDVDLPPVHAAGWQASAGVGIRRVELAARFAALEFTSAGGSGDPQYHPRAATFTPTGARAWTVGGTLRFNRWVRLQVNTMREAFTDPGRSPLAPGRAFWTTVCRTQIAL